MYFEVTDKLWGRVDVSVSWVSLFVMATELPGQRSSLLAKER